MADQSPLPRRRLFLYPDAIPAPQSPPRVERKQNPAMRGYILVLAALAMEMFGFVRQLIWANAGFNSLRPIRRLIEDTEPRFDPTVFPVEPEDAVETVDKEEEREPLKPLAPAGSRRYSVEDYRALYLSGELTPLDVVNAILPLVRRDTAPPGEHSMAWVDVQVDLVLAAAKASTQRYKEKKSLGPLDGVPTAVKDEYDMEGYRTYLGSRNDYTGKLLEDGKVDAWCVRKLQEAGIIIVGKLNMHEFGMDTTGNNVVFGTPRNPYNKGYYTGGSSSGSAYAVSAGLVPMTLGSDGGGSIRIPASYCSVFGLKPTHGRLSCLPNQNHSNTNGVNGPIAADIRSLAAIYNAVSPPHPSTYFPSPSPPTAAMLSRPLNRPKLLGIPESWFRRADPGVQALCRAMIDRLVAHKGYTTVDIDFPFQAEGQMAHAVTILNDAATLLPPSRDPEYTGLSPANRILLALSRATPATDWLLAQKLRRVLMQHLAWLWREKYPGMLIVTPVSACAGWPIHEKGGGELKYGVSDGDRTLRSMEYVWLANFLGPPSLAVPAGYVVPEGRPNAGDLAGKDSKGKVPVGLMATGEWAGEQELLRFGLDCEEVMGPEEDGILCRPDNWVDIIELAKSQRGQ